MTKYWVGGTGNWSDSTNHWALSSGGLPIPLNVPTSSDDVVIDSNSGFGGGGTITLDTNGVCNDFLANSGHSYTLFSNTNTRIDAYGSVTLEAGITFDGTRFDFYATTTGKTITLAGNVMSEVGFYGVGGGWTLQDDLSVLGGFYHENGTFDANNHNVTANDFYFYADTGFTPTIIMGSGTWEATGVDWYVDEYSGEVLTVTPETSTIKLSGGGNFYTSDKTYHNLWFTTSGGITLGSSTFNDLKTNAGLTVTFLAGTTQTISSFTALGTAGNLITLNRNGGAGSDQFTLSKSSGIVSCDYLNISNSNAIGGAKWYAGAHSADTANNDGWIFEDQPHRMGVSNFQDPGVV